MNQPLVSLHSATVSRPDVGVVLRDLNWEIRDGESWAIVGPVGSGKTTLAELIAGRLRLDSGKIVRPERVELVSFREESRLFSPARHYYQERFNFSDPHEDITLAAFLHQGSGADLSSIAMTSIQLGIAPLVDLPLIKLSNGQMRRARIARALLAKPDLLILDDPFLGLDDSGRDEVAELLGDLICDGQRVLLIARPEMLPGWVTNVLQIAALEVGRVSRVFETGQETRPTSIHTDAGVSPIITLRHVNVTYADRRILSDINWTVRRGERWAVLGPNGSGKSTLLSLLCGDHPQAYSNEICLFDKRRGSGESIWDIKRRIGLVSPELHIYFHEPLTAAQTVATGFFDVVAYRPTSTAQNDMVKSLLEQFDLAHLAKRLFSRLSTGEQRLILFLRAIVKRPELLILDEPFQGLDARWANRLRDWLDANLDTNQTVLFVTHLGDEIPRTASHRLLLDDGRMQIAQ